jgi:hypothetical protein
LHFSWRAEFAISCQFSSRAAVTMRGIRCASSAASWGAWHSDIRKLVDIIKQVVASHPQVLS